MPFPTYFFFIIAPSLPLGLPLVIVAASFHPCTLRYLALEKQQHQSSLPAICRLVSITRRAGNAVTCRSIEHRQ